MGPSPYIQLPIWHPDFIGKGTCPAPNNTRRCRNKRTCDLRRRERGEQQDRVVSLRDELVGRWRELKAGERFGLADSLARLSVCAGCERKGTRAIVRDVVLEQLETEFGVEKVERLGGDEVEKDEVQDVSTAENDVDRSVLILRDNEKVQEADRKTDIGQDAEADEAVSFPAFHEIVSFDQLQQHEQYDQADRKLKVERSFEEEAAASSSTLFDEIVFIQQYNDHDTSAIEDGPISSTPPSARTASTRHHSSSPPTDLTLNSSPPDLPRLIINPEALADFCFETPFYDSRPDHLPSTPLSGSEQTPLTGLIHAISHLPSPTTPSKGARDVQSPEVTTIAQEDGESTVRQSRRLTSSSLQIHSLECQNALLQEQLQDMRRDLDTADLKARAARAEADRWRKVYQTLKESVIWFFERNEQMEQDDEEPDPFLDEEPELDDGASWSSEGEELAEVYWPLKVPKKREPPTQRVDSGLGGFVEQGEVLLPPVPPMKRRRRRTTGRLSRLSLGSIVEEREAEEKEDR